MARASLHSSPPSVMTVSLPADELNEAIAAYLDERFALLNLDHPHIAQLYVFAFEREQCNLLSGSGKGRPITKTSNLSFQPVRPPKVDVKALISNDMKLGSLPTVLTRLIEVLHATDPQPDNITEIIEMEPDLAARLLRLVNSVHYGFSSKVLSIGHAVRIVGTRPLILLATSAVVLSTFKGLPISLVSMEAFWKHSVCCGVGARILAKACDIPEPESFFAAGLMHDIARLFMYTSLPEHSMYALTESRRRRVPMREVETEVFGMPHDEMGRLMLSGWEFPTQLIDLACDMRSPTLPECTPEQAVLPVAHVLAQTLGIGTSGDPCIYPVSPCVWDALNISPEKTKLYCIQIEKAFREMRTLLNS